VRNKVSRFKGPYSVMAKGSEMHSLYSAPYGSFERRLLRYKLGTVGRVFSRAIESIDGTDGITVVGIPDDYRVLKIDSGQSVSIIEVKTTSKSRLWSNEQAVAKFQLQLYVWLMEPILTDLGYELYCHHWVEMFHQGDWRLLGRIMVVADPEIEKKILCADEMFKGLRSMKVPEEWICKKCPGNVKRSCDWYHKRV